MLCAPRSKQSSNHCRPETLGLSSQAPAGMPPQVYSTELVATLGSACGRLLDGLAAYMARARRREEGHPAPDPHLAPRVIFALLQNPLNGALLAPYVVV